MVDALKKSENESYLDWKYRVLIGKVNGDIDASWDDIEKELNIGIAKDSIRKGSIFLPEFKDYLTNKLVPEDKLPDYKESLDINKDGSYTSDKLVKLNKDKLKDQIYMLEAHGFDPNEWELVSARNNIWNVSAGVNPNKTLYSSRISVKPKVNGINIESLVSTLTKDIKPFTMKSKTFNGAKGLLEIPLVDMHFGINTFESYQETLVEILELIKLRKWDTIYIPIGNDLLHNNDFKGRTASGTIIDKVDMIKAWEDAFIFYSHIYETALLNAVNVISDYVPGNHDTEMSWALTKSLEVKFPQVKWDTSVKAKKMLSWKDILLVNLHGDKGLQRVVDGLITKYRELMVGKKTVEIHSGHLHSEKVKDKYGIIIRTLPTSAEEDNWHEDMSFEGANKTFQVFEYNESKLKKIHYV